MPDLSDADYTLTVTETMLIGPDGDITWIPCYWEVRNSSQGYQVCEAVRVSTHSPWIVREEDGEHTPITPAQLRNGETPDVIVDRMLERGLFA